MLFKAHKANGYVVGAWHNERLSIAVGARSSSWGARDSGTSRLYLTVAAWKSRIETQTPQTLKAEV